MPNVYSNGTYIKRIDYNSQGGSAVDQTRGSKSSNAASVSVSASVSTTVPTKTGYTFNGWNSKSDGSGTNYAAGDSISHTFTRQATWDHTETIHGIEYNYFTVSNQSHTTTIYAKWTVLTYTVSYNANGGSGAPSAQTKTYGVTLTLSSTQPTRTGYTFLGWSTSSTATSATYSAGGSYTANAAATLYAVWQIITYTVSYNKGSNGTGTNSSATKTYNVTLTLNGAQFTRTGYAQTGWATSDGGAQAYSLGGSYTANASVTLYPVWTATKSTVSTTNGTLGTAQTITITRYNTSFTHTLTYKYGNATGTIATGVGASYSWTPPTSLAAQFPAATSGVCTITCTTYSGSTNIGSSTTTCTLSIPSSVKCTVGTVTVTEAVTGLASKFGAFIQGKSKATISATINSGSGSPAYGATVSAYSITTNGQTLTSNGATTGILSTSGSNSYSFKITDTRGYSDTKSSTYNVLAYSSPKISASIGRNASDDSKIDISYSYTISPCNDRNDKALSIKYRVVGGNYTTIPITISSYTGSNITYQITGLDANTAYEVVVSATDYFTTASTTTNIQPTGNRVFDISDDDKTIARHGTNYSDGWDHQYFNEKFHGVVDVIPRRCSATLPTTGNGAGWYRVFDVTGGLGCAGSAFSIVLHIGRAYNMDNTELHTVTLLANYYNQEFSSEVSKSNTLGITKVRYTTDGSNNGHIDIYYDLTTENFVYVDFDVHCRPENAYLIRFNAVTPTAVAEAPNGETEPTRYTFAANTMQQSVTIPSSQFSSSNGTIWGSESNVKLVWDNKKVVMTGFIFIQNPAAGVLYVDFPTPTGFPYDKFNGVWLIVGQIYRRAGSYMQPGDFAYGVVNSSVIRIAERNVFASHLATDYAMITIPTATYYF